jgi:hypothetical protein
MCARLDTTGLLADVTYAILHGNTDAGRERCRLYRRAVSGYWLTCEIDLTAPGSRSLYIEAHIAIDWLVESLKIRSFGQEHRDASYYIEGSTWRATIQTDETTIERAVPDGPGVLVDFDPIGGMMLALRQIQLQERQTQPIDTLRIEQPSLEPVRVQQQIECIGREFVKTSVGDFDAIHYFAKAKHWWADSHGIIVAASGYQLVEYHWLESASRVE